MKKVFLALAVVAFATFAVACGNAPQQGGQATEIQAAGCCSATPTCCSEGLTSEQCTERKEAKSCCARACC